MTGEGAGGLFVCFAPSLREGIRRPCGVVVGGGGGASLRGESNAESGRKRTEVGSRDCGSWGTGGQGGGGEG